MIDGVRAIQVQADIEGNFANIDGLHFRRDNAGGYTMNGSLHKYHNQGKDNAGDFRYTDIVDTIYRLADELAINPEITKITRLEFGVNIIFPVDAYRVIDSAVLFRDDTGEYDNIGRTFHFSDYEFKIYNKSKQSYLDDNIIRIEVKVTQLRHLRKKNINILALSDLLDKDVLNGLKRVLIDTFTSCIFIYVPAEIETNLSDKDKIKYLEYTSPNYWNKVRRDKSKNLTREKKRCEKFIREIGGVDLKENLIEQITEKCDYLLNFPDAKVSGFSKKNIKQTDGESVRIFQENIKQKNSEVSGFSSLDNSGKFRQTDLDGIAIRCAGCGAIITCPKKGQKFCSAKEVGYKNAHKCRNIASNPRNNAKRSIRRVLSIPLMFDLGDMIDQKKEQYLSEI